MVVADASALIDAFLRRPRVAERLLVHEMHAVASVDAEVLHGVRRLWLQRLLTDDDVTTVLSLLRHTRITRHVVTPFLSRMWALRDNVTAYDAGYVALAESLNVPLLTRDLRLSRSSGHAAVIEYIA